ncbi:BZ3500_MvSof-1268-A1-R1_Chr3-2g06244 [Microbotryum saponariae]|uniref:BZ3500_MvSof-1268-A1-R1_Chr3-2g06243 protein n=1 Tax=Microbotryum saponariae TaxID=289078 RepID=A0A2X0LGT1_9BASI|nr:BZ3500_MvSof-1268-A1-R1_Chr3-2g06243 [Microbotryum saponariae]SCZ98244.1 BZ3500_MvSof-1268-A1-R1_Chr3-2g06244 [Microbotryum saponariae]SDA04188.1 BZ3501_MvSof-1269-A2-R1_Chr3-2g05934 [Microbotryum saponariae]SDA04190.1 BZ3501_MvSof-1269-A2-R1_Chr3-2g05935 [Microbotryum saponariae]
MAEPTPPPDTTSSSDAAALANLQADYAALVAKITRLEASQSAASAPAKQEKPTDGMPSTIVVPEAYMLKGRENFVEWDGFLNMFLPDDVYNYLTGGRDNVKWTDAYYARGQEYASRVLIASIDPICSSDIIPIRQMKGTAHECWLELASRYRPSDAQGDPRWRWAGHVRIIVNSMRNLNIDFEQILTARLLLNMPQLYNNWKSTFNQRQAAATTLPKIEDLIFSLRREVRSMGEHPINGATPAYIVSPQHSQNRSNARSQRPNEASSPCPVCDEGKHWADQCPDTDRRRKYFELKSALRDLKLQKSTTSPSNHENVSSFVTIPAPAPYVTAPPSSQEHDDFFMSLHTTTPNATQQTDFLLDSASPFHIVNDRSLFSGQLKPSSHHIVGIGGQTAVKGTGSVELRTDRGVLVKLNNVHFAPNAPANIVSVFQMGSKGVRTSFTRGRAELSTVQSGIFATATATTSNHYRLNVTLATAGKLTVQKWHASQSPPRSSRLSSFIAFSQPSKSTPPRTRTDWTTPNRFRLLPTDPITLYAGSQRLIETRLTRWLGLKSRASRALVSLPSSSIFHPRSCARTQPLESGSSPPYFLTGYEPTIYQQSH